MLCAVFYILDLAAINAHILHKSVAGSKILGRRYLLRLSEELRAKLVEERKANNSQESIQYSHSNSCMQKTNKRNHCQSKNCTNKTRETWCICTKFVCGKCIEKQEKLNYYKICCQLILLMVFVCFYYVDFFSKAYKTCMQDLKVSFTFR